VAYRNPNEHRPPSANVSPCALLKFGPLKTEPRIFSADLELAKRSERGDMAAQRQLVRQNLPRLEKRFPGRGDIVRGVADWAAYRYDWRRGDTFLTYAVRRLRTIGHFCAGVCGSSPARAVPRPREARRRSTGSRRARSPGRLGEDPDPAEALVAARSGGWPALPEVAA
jgi:hypothetical protein